MQQQHGRRGAVFSIRLTADERAQLEALQQTETGPRSLGAFLKWRALTVETGPGPVVPRRGTTRSIAGEGTTAPRRGTTAAEVVPELRYYPPGPSAPPITERLILDLCGGSGSWSQPYRDAGYRVELVTLPEHDVRTYVPPRDVWGVLAAPPCTEFSPARNGQNHRQRPRDFILGMETVNACLRVILQARPVWWALENPVGQLAHFLGTPRDVWEPCDFGDPWTKRTALWGDFAIPARGPFVKPLGGGPFCRVCDPGGTRASWCANAAHRAVTPAGFARAFFEANP